MSVMHPPNRRRPRDETAEPSPPSSRAAASRPGRSVRSPGHGAERPSRTSLPPARNSRPAPTARNSRPTPPSARKSAAAGPARGGAKGRAGAAPGASVRRTGAWLARFRLLTGIIVVITASVLVAWGLRRYLRSSPRFAIKSVVVEGNGRRTATQIARRAGAELGENIFTLDLQVARESVEADEWVERATVARELPNTVRIGVDEREARALATVDGQLLLVDGKGNLFKKLRPGDPSDLPVVTGLSPKLLAADLDGVRQRLRRVLDVVAELQRTGIARRFPIQEVHLEPDDTLVVTIGSDGIALQLGRPPYRAKVAKVDRILAEVARRKAKPGVVFLDDDAHPERVVVRMR